MLVMDMDEVNEPNESVQEPDALTVPADPAPPIDSRFLFVGVAALRAKQLRRGARVRFDSGTEANAPCKPERMAMEEVRRGLVYYDVPGEAAAHAEADA
jgi:DNA-directed RNA polymerase subunit K/omega